MDELYRKSKDHVKLPVAHYGHTGNHTPVFHSLTANLRGRHKKLKIKPQINNCCARTICRTL